MDKKPFEALLLLLKDPDVDTFDAVTESLISGVDVIPVLEALWERADDELSLSRLEWLLYQVRFNRLKDALVEWKRKGATDIIEGAWLISTFDHHEVTLAEITALITNLVKDVWLEIREEQSLTEKIARLNHIMFDKHGLYGDIEDMQSLHNSFIHQVLRAKKGNDIVLAIIYMGIAQKLYIPVYGVPLPHNFILACLDERDSNQNIIQKEVMFYINPFNGGVIFSDSEIRRFIREQQMPFDPVYFQPCSNLATIEALANRLFYLYEQKGMSTKARDMNILLQILRKD